MIALAVILISAFILHRTVLGVHVYAVGGNPLAARLTGIPVGTILIFVYGISGFLSGLGGVMTASRLYSAQGRLGEGYELDAIAAVILGGTSFSGGIGTVFGTLIGALIVAVLNNGLTLMNVSFYWQLVVKGAVIILAVLLDRLRTRGQALIAFEVQILKRLALRARCLLLWTYQRGQSALETEKILPLVELLKIFGFAAREVFFEHFFHRFGESDVLDNC